MEAAVLLLVVESFEVAAVLPEQQVAVAVFVVAVADYYTLEHLGTDQEVVDSVPPLVVVVNMVAAAAAVDIGQLVAVVEHSLQDRHFGIAVVVAVARTPAVEHIDLASEVD